MTKDQLSSQEPNIAKGPLPEIMKIAFLSLQRRPECEEEITIRFPQEVFKSCCKGHFFLRAHDDFFLLCRKN
jgi:hypothetical protein